MIIDISDKRLYELCQKVLDSNQLDPELHEKFSTVLDDSNLQSAYFFDEYLIKALDNLERSSRRLKQYADNVYILNTKKDTSLN